jgi:hypothetical protein
LDDECSPVGCPGANLIRAPLIRRTLGFAAGSSSSSKVSRFRGAKCVSATAIDLRDFERLDHRVIS